MLGPARVWVHSDELTRKVRVGDGSKRVRVINKAGCVFQGLEVIDTELFERHFHEHWVRGTFLHVFPFTSIFDVFETSKPNAVRPEQWEMEFEFTVADSPPLRFRGSVLKKDVEEMTGEAAVQFYVLCQTYRSSFFYTCSWLLCRVWHLVAFSRKQRSPSWAHGWAPGVCGWVNQDFLHRSSQNSRVEREVDEVMTAIAALERREDDSPAHTPPRRNSQHRLLRNFVGQMQRGSRESR